MTILVLNLKLQVHLAHFLLSIVLIATSRGWVRCRDKLNMAASTWLLRRALVGSRGVSYHIKKLPNTLKALRVSFPCDLLLWVPKHLLKLRKYSIWTFCTPFSCVRLALVQEDPNMNTKTSQDFQALWTHITQKNWNLMIQTMEKPSRSIESWIEMEKSLTKPMTPRCAAGFFYLPFLWFFSREIEKLSRHHSPRHLDKFFSFFASPEMTDSRDSREKSFLIVVLIDVFPWHCLGGVLGAGSYESCFPFSISLTLFPFFFQISFGSEISKTLM